MLVSESECIESGCALPSNIASSQNVHEFHLTSSLRILRFGTHGLELYSYEDRNAVAQRLSLVHYAFHRNGGLNFGVLSVCSSIS